MREEILNHLNNPRQLEKMYRRNSMIFKREFITLYPEIKGNAIVDCWNERLNYESEEISWGNRRELLLVVVASLVAGIIAKLPAILSINEEQFYTRNISFIILPLLTAYFAWKNKIPAGQLAVTIITTVAGLLFINFFPGGTKSNTLILSCVHLPLMLWSLLGFAYVGEMRNNPEKRLAFLKFNGDLIVITTLIVIAGGILSAITVGLFSVIGFNIQRFYFENVVIFCLPAAPILGTYLTLANPQLVGKVSPVIAKIFSPLVLVMLIIYLPAMVYSGKDPYNDREFLLIFNVLLIGVMALIFFSVADMSRTVKSRTETGVLFLLSVITLVVNGFALSAILFRIAEFGNTPNRIAVLGGNVLILVNLLMVTAQLFKVLSKKGDINGVGKSIASFLPVYFGWTVIVTFLFPLLFGFK